MAAFVRSREQGVDFSFARPPAARLLELGYTFVVGYISVPPASPGKNISKAQCEAYLDAGLNVLLVWEMAATRPDLGATYGAIDGKNAARLALALGYPTDVPILCAADLNTFAANIDRHEAYMRGFADTCDPYPMGIYGDTDILARCAGLWHIGWVPIGAWAWSGTSYANAIAKAKAVGAHVLQRKGFYIDNVWAVDPNDAIGDFPVWSALPDPPLPPPQGGDIMPYVIFELQDADAALYGQADKPGGVVAVVYWSGADRDAWEAARKVLVDFGDTEIRKASVGNFKHARLPPTNLPTGDTRHTWTGDEFLNAAEIKAANAPVSAQDEQARADIVFLKAELGTQSTGLDKLGALFDRFKAGLRSLGSD